MKNEIIRGAIDSFLVMQSMLGNKWKEEFVREKSVILSYMLRDHACIRMSIGKIDNYYRITFFLVSDMVFYHKNIKLSNFIETHKDTKHSSIGDYIIHYDTEEEVVNFLNEMALVEGDKNERVG